MTVVLRNNWVQLIFKDSVAFEARSPPRYGKMLSVMEGVKTIITMLSDLTTFFWLFLRPQSTLAAENLFLRKQLAIFHERKAKSRRPDTPIQITIALLYYDRPSHLV